MNYALIGCGRIAVNHVKAAVNNGLDFVAACDAAAQNIDLLFDKTGFAERDKVGYYTDYKKLIAEHPEIELVAVATSSGTHAEIALYCIEHGINVIIEKPIAMSIADANEIVRKSRECQGLCQPSEQVQYRRSENAEGS